MASRLSPPLLRRGLGGGLPRRGNRPLLHDLLRASLLPAGAATRAAATCAAFALALGIPAMVGGNLEVIHRRIPMAWSTVCELLGGFILLLAVYHAVVLVPLGEQLVRKRNDYKALLLEDLRKLTDRRYFRFEMLFLLLFLLPEGFFYRVGILFLVDPGSNGGLSLSPQELAFTRARWVPSACCSVACSADAASTSTASAIGCGR